MATALVLVVLVGLIVARFAYGNWLTNGIKPRSFETKLPAETLRSVFEEKVARAGWKIVDDGNPLVAQSSLATGIRQQIALSTGQQGECTVARISPNRWTTKWGVPSKAHTMRMRMNSFLVAARAQDPTITLTIEALKSSS